VSTPRFLAVLKHKSSKALSALIILTVLSVVFISLIAVTYERTYAIHTQCSDGVDNDRNGLTDYPQDPGCSSLDDDYEGTSTSGNFITVTDERDTVQPGDAASYIITLKQQREEARNVDVLLHLPFQANIVSASDGGAVSPDAVRWTNVSVYRNVTRTLTVNVNVRPDAQPGQYLAARAQVTGEADATDTTLVSEQIQPQQADLFRISLSDGREYILPGEDLVYTARVRNNGTRTTVSDVRLALPYEVSYVSASDGGRRDSYNVTWKNVRLEPREEKTFTTTARVEYRAADRLTLRAKVYAGAAIALDQTVVRIGLPYDAITASITDRRDMAQVGDLLTYIVTVKNSSPVVGTNVSVDAALPLYGEFVSATEGGRFDGSNVRWLILQVAPNDTRTLHYTVRVRSDAPQGARLTASVSADDYVSRDSTFVGNRTEASGGGRVIFRKSADRGETVPGGGIRYTLFVRNTLDRVISDASILDRYDSTYLSLVSENQTQNLVSSSPGQMQWRVPELRPGDTWTVSYILRVSPDAPGGIELNNVASLSSSELQDISLTERVRTLRAGVMTDFPETGAAMDTLLALALAVSALVTTGIQRKLAFGRVWL